ncbi:hypothetical protein SULYE_1511 [Sulfurihydrogenibium yellowstonense SS-5]|uniref:Uncharacterized protein n=1 Tax=Sulfurihydrogenibium yellowstonense SS-5 TaxID=432331 RepID=C4FLQ6_9AQUI|nr:hypothetical protein SULYE_1511 [Sulfurihydrogenibium yellowstonense SS-5]
MAKTCQRCHSEAGKKSIFTLFPKKILEKLTNKGKLTKNLEQPPIFLIIFLS